MLDKHIGSPAFTDSSYWIFSLTCGSVTQAGLVKDIIIRAIKDKRELKSKSILHDKSLAHAFVPQLEMARDRLLRCGL